MEQSLRELTELLTQKDRSLKESLQFSNALFELNPVPIVVTTVPAGVIIKANEAFLSFSGYGLEELVGKTTERLYANVQDRLRVIEKIQKKGFVSNELVSFRTKEGHRFAGAMYVNLVEINGVKHFVSVIIDRTENKRLEAESCINREELLCQGEELRRLVGKQELDAAQFKMLLSIYLEDTSPRRVLVIDDDEDNLAVIRALLTTYLKSPCIIYTSNTGENGLDLANLYDPDVILLDIRMPGMDGIEVCKQMKSCSPLAMIPILFITAFADEQDIKRTALAAGGDGFIAKPVDTVDLIAQILSLSKIKVLNKIKAAGLFDMKVEP
jgi:PAS domain S-box-containing protein